MHRLVVPFCFVFHTLWLEVSQGSAVRLFQELCTCLERKVEEFPVRMHSFTESRGYWPPSIWMIETPELPKLGFSFKCARWVTILIRHLIFSVECWDWLRSQPGVSVELLRLVGRRNEGSQWYQIPVPSSVPHDHFPPGFPYLGWC